MKTKLVILGILLLGFISFVVVKFYILDRQDNNGQLKVLASPTASVFVNNVAIGKTPFFDQHPVGEYILKLIPEGTATETASWQGKFTVFKNAMTYVNIELGSTDLTTAGEILMTTKIKNRPHNNKLGAIEVQTEPVGAIVSLDNDEKGVAPILIDDVMEGDHELSVFLPGFFRRTVKINVDPGYQVTANFKLAIDQAQQVGLKTEEDKSATESATTTTKGAIAIIKDTPTGWLRVREEPSINASESAKIKPGERYEIIEEKTDWLKIKYNNRPEGLVEGKFEEGWVSSAYVTKE